MLEKIPFSQDEMVPLLVQPSMFGDPSRTVFHVPISLRDNYLSAVRNHDYLYVANALDAKNMNTRIIPDNRARGSVGDGGERFIPNPEGEPDVFGVPWLFDPEVGGSMVRPGKPLLTDIEDWEEVIIFPDPDAWDWEGAAKMSEEFRSDGFFAYQSTIFTGFFERLISWMDFEEAAIAMIDEDSEDAVHALFSNCADLYIKYIDNIAKYFNTDIIELHDDWGSQMAPFMAEDVYREKIFPYLKRGGDRIHEHGMVFTLHSCGHIESLVGIMVDAGVDMWMGQEINDKKAVFDTWGDKLCVQTEVPECGLDATDDEIWEAAEKFCDDFIADGKAATLSIYSKHRKNRPFMTDAVYEISRKRLS